MIRNPDCDLCSFGVNSPRPPLNVCIMHAKPTPHDVMVVAQMPGNEDDKYGGIFSDRLLSTVRKKLEAEGIDAYYTYAVKCRKPDPKAKVNATSHVKTCSTAYLHKEIEVVRPKHIICFGGDSMYAASKDKGIGSKQGQRFWSKNADAWIYPTYHNATCLYDIDKRKAMWNELSMFLRMIRGEQVDFNPPLKMVTTLQGLRILQKKIRKAGGKAAVDIETNGLDMFAPDFEVRCIQFCFDEEYGGVFVPLSLADEDDCFEGFREVKKTVMKGRGSKKVPVEMTELEKVPAERFWQDGETLAEAVEILREILLETRCAWHNGKFDRKSLYKWGERRFGAPIECPRIWIDTMHAAHVINENRAAFKLKKLIIEEFGFPSYDIPDKLTKDLSILIPYSTNDTVATLMLVKKYLGIFNEPGHEKLKRLYFKMIRPMDRIYTEIELEGWPADLSVALQKQAIITRDIQALLPKLDAYLEDRGYVFDEDEERVAFDEDGKLNLPKRYSSGDKLAFILFEFLKLPVSPNPKLAYTDDKKLSVDVDALLHVRRDEFVRMLFKLKKAGKALSTYIQPMIQQSRKYGRLMTTYRLAGPVTGRTASGKEDKKSGKGDAMNMQNMPRIYSIKDVVAPGINPITGKRRVMVATDFSQIELVIVANESQDKLMMWAYQNGVDLHTYRAVRSMGLDKELLEQGLSVENWQMVLKEGQWALLSASEKKLGRLKAKPVNFGFAYGAGVSTFIVYAAKSYDIDFTDLEGKAMRDLFFSDHAGLPKWYARVERFANKHGYVESLSGRRRRLPQLLGGAPDYSDSREKKAAYSSALRMAINSPIQGFGSDLKLMSMIEIRKRLIKKGWYYEKCLQTGEIHDEISLWVDEDIAVEVARIKLEVMRHPPLMDEFEIDFKVPINAEAAIGISLGQTAELAAMPQATEETGVDYEIDPIWIVKYILLRDKYDKDKDPDPVGRARKETIHLALNEAKK